MTFSVKSQDFTEQNLSNPDNIPAPVFPVPTERQLNWMETEFYGFSHYGPNTFMGTEWGNDAGPILKSMHRRQYPIAING